MKLILKVNSFILFLITIIVLVGCSKGPKDDVVKDDINNYFNKRKDGINYMVIKDINIVGREQVSGITVVQCKVKAKNVIKYITGQTEEKDVNLDVTVRYTKFGDEWKPDVSYEVR
ncbi:MAG TPA: hypothetical protein VIL99_02955 [Ignavibacteria bacterium]